MATFSVDITSVVFAASHSGYKDITIEDMPISGVTGSITGTDANSFGFRIPGSQDDESVYRVYTTGTNSSSSSKSAVFRLTNNSNSSDYVEVDISQMGSTLESVVFDVICESPSIVSVPKYVEGVYQQPPVYNNVYANYSNGGDSTARCTVLLDGAWSIPSSSNIPEWVSLVTNTVYTDTGFKQVYVSFVNNYSGPRSGDVVFGNSNYDFNKLHCFQDGYPSSTSGNSPEVLTFPKAGDTLSVSLKHPQISETIRVDSDGLYNIYGYDYEITKSTVSSYETTINVQLPQNPSNDLKESVIVYYYFTSSYIYVYLGHTVLKQLGDGPVQTLTVDPASLSYPATGGGKVLNVTYATSLSTNTFPSWLSATYVSTGTGSRSYTITATANSSSESRSFNLVLSDANMSVTVPISQTGGTPASLTISPTSGLVGYAAGTVNITVTSSGIGSIDFNISDTSWVSYSGKSGNVYTFYYSSNTGAVSRTNTIVFSGGGLSRTYTLTQSPTTPSDFSISPTSGIWSKAGAGGEAPAGVSQVYFTDQVNPVTATSSASWISATIYSSYGIVSPDANNTGAQRTGTVTFRDNTGAAQIYTVTQAGNNIMFVPSSVSFNADGTGGPDELYVLCNTSNGNFVSSTIPSWLHISKIGITNTRISYLITADENISTSSRSATVQFSEAGGQYTGSLQVTQAGASAPGLTVSPTSGTVNSDAGTVRITVTGSNISYSSSQGWLRYSSISGNVYTFSYTANYSASQRTAVITFTSGGQSGTYTLTQMGMISSNIAVSPVAVAIANGDTFADINVIYSGQFTVTNNSDWVSCPSSGTASEVTSFRFIFDENEGTMRSANILFRGDNNTSCVCQLYQAAHTDYIIGKRPILSTERLNHQRAGTSSIVAVNYDDYNGDTLTYSNLPSWLSMEQIDPDPGLSPAMDIGIKVFRITSSANPGTQRGFNIVFTANGLYGEKSSTLVLVQEGGSTPPPTGDGYDPIWMDDYYIPSGWSPSSGDNRYYPYMLKDELTGSAIYEGVAVIPAGWGGSAGGINIPRIVENFLNSDFYYSHSGWNNMVYSYRTIGLYNMSNPLSPQLVETFKYFNDWSRCRTVYNRSQILNDPINFKGCQHMYMPLCVFCNDSSTFSIFGVGLEGDTETYDLGNPGYTFAQETDRFSGVKSLDYQMNGQTIYSYDMTHCGPGALIYRNRFGGWDSFLIEGNVEKSEDYIKQNYTLPDDNFNRTLRFRNNKVTMRNNITTTYEANTGWLSDEESERLVFHLLSSPQVWYQNFEINQFDTDRDGDYGMHPVRITNANAKYKKFRNGRRLVSYTITFEDSNTIQVMR